MSAFFLVLPFLEAGFLSFAPCFGFRRQIAARVLPRSLWLGLPLLAFVFSCSDPRPSNVLLVTFDTTRWDHLGYAVGEKNLTPVLDEMAAGGTWFSRCLTTQPLTLPSHTSIMTGLFPDGHGVRNNGTYIVPESDVTLAERLREAGFETHAIIGAFVLDSQFGLSQGFEEYDDDLRGGAKAPLFMFKELPAARIADKAIDWLEKRKPNKRFFLWLHFFDPHANYSPPDKIAMEFAGEPYKGEIHYADRELGRVLEKLKEQKLLEETLFAFTADHGESLGEHGEKTHGLFIYRSTMRVPLLLRGPGIPSGMRVDSLVRTVDIAPTILELLGLEGVSEMDGKTLLPLIHGETDERGAYMETMAPFLNFGWAPLRGEERGSVKVIEAPRPEVYDLESDPKERRNLHGKVGEEVDGGRGLLVELRRRIAEDPFTKGEHREAEMDPETRAKLAALGYVWGGTWSEKPEDLPDPKDRLKFWTRFEASQNLIRQGKTEAAVQAISGLLEEDPKNVLAKSSLANALVRLGAKEEALKQFREVIAMDPARDTAYLGAAKILREFRQYKQARQLIQAVLDMHSANPAAYVSMGDTYLEEGKYGDAERWFRKAVKLDPNSMLAASGLGNCLNRQNRLQEALEVLRSAHRKDTTSYAVTYNLGIVSERLGDQKAAEALYRQAIVLDPEASTGYNNLGSLLDRMGRRKEAIPSIRKAAELDPDNVEAVYNLGVLLTEEGSPEEGLPFLRSAFNKRPSFQQAGLFLSQTLQKLGKNDEAIQVLEKLGRYQPAIWLVIAKLRLEKGQRRAAIKALRQGVAKGGARFRKAAARDPGLEKLMADL